MFTGISFVTQIGKHSTQYVMKVYNILAGTFVLTVGIAYADQSVNEWLSWSVIDHMTRCIDSLDCEVVTNDTSNSQSAEGGVRQSPPRQFPATSERGERVAVAHAD